jgi:hypothetical protein
MNDKRVIFDSTGERIISDHRPGATSTAAPRQPAAPSPSPSTSTGKSLTDILNENKPQKPSEVVINGKRYQVRVKKQLSK